jgi:hypothetical protein
LLYILQSQAFTQSVSLSDCHVQNSVCMIITLVFSLAVQDKGKNTSTNG